MVTDRVGHAAWAEGRYRLLSQSELNYLGVTRGRQSGPQPGPAAGQAGEVRPFRSSGTGGVDKISMAPLITKRRTDQGHTNQRGLAP